MRSLHARSTSDAAGASSERPPFDPRAILTSIGEVVYDWDIATDAITWGANARDVLRVPDLVNLASGAAFALCVEPAVGLTRHEAIFQSDAEDPGTGVPYRTRYKLRLRPGRIVAVEDSGRWFADAGGRPAYAHGVLRVERDAEDGEEVGAGARHRAVLLDRLKHDIAEARQAKRSLALIVLSVDELGRLNEDLGYEGADAVLDEMVRRVRRVMRGRDYLLRYAGNRFALALRSCEPDQAAAAAARIEGDVCREPIRTSLGPLALGLRMGAALAPLHAADPASLLRRAEEALAATKRRFGCAFSLYDPAAAAVRGAQRATPVFDIIEALNGRRITFAAQPVLEARSRTLAFKEALLRVRAADGRIVPAGDILPAVERTGLVPLIDTRILELVADHLARHPDERLAINLSPVTLENPNWLTTFAAHLGARPGIAPRLIVEITETAMVRDSRAICARLDAMKALGVAVAVDDFGAGHTSFKHLRSFPVDILKIDGAFVHNLSRSTDDRFFVRALLDLAQHLGIATVAEWVENEETARLLAEWGVDYLQGRHCGLPELLDEPAAGEAAA